MWLHVHSRVFCVVVLEDLAAHAVLEGVQSRLLRKWGRIEPSQGMGLFQHLARLAPTHLCGLVVRAIVRLAIQAQRGPQHHGEFLVLLERVHLRGNVNGHVNAICLGLADESVHCGRRGAGEKWRCGNCAWRSLLDQPLSNFLPSGLTAVTVKMSFKSSAGVSPAAAMVLQVEPVAVSASSCGIGPCPEVGTG